MKVHTALIPNAASTSAANALQNSAAASAAQYSPALNATLVSLPQPSTAVPSAAATSYTTGNSTANVIMIAGGNTTTYSTTNATAYSATNGTTLVTANTTLVTSGNGTSNNNYAVSLNIYCVDNIIILLITKFFPCAVRQCYR